MKPNHIIILDYSDGTVHVIPATPAKVVDAYAGIVQLWCDKHDRRVDNCNWMAYDGKISWATPNPEYVTEYIEVLPVAYLKMREVERRYGKHYRNVLEGRLEEAMIQDLVDVTRIDLLRFASNDLEDDDDRRFANDICDELDKQVTPALKLLGRPDTDFDIIWQTEKR